MADSPGSVNSVTVTGGERGPEGYVPACVFSGNDSRPEGLPPEGGRAYPQAEVVEKSRRGRGVSGKGEPSGGLLPPLKAARAFCLWCCLDSPKEVRLCPATGPIPGAPDGCPLHKIRLGRGVPKGLSVLKAIRHRCLDCTGFEPKRVRKCHFDGIKDKFCPLWPYRMGQRPKISDMTTDETTHLESHAEAQAERSRT